MYGDYELHKSRYVNGEPSVLHIVVNKRWLFIFKLINTGLSKFGGVSHPRLLKVYTSENHTYLAVPLGIFPKWIIMIPAFKINPILLFLDGPQTLL